MKGRKGGFFVALLLFFFFLRARLKGVFQHFSCFVPAVGNQSKHVYLRPLGLVFSSKKKKKTSPSVSLSTKIPLHRIERTASHIEKKTRIFGAG